MTPFVCWYPELTKVDVAVAGGKGANLGEMTRAGLPVPPGFVVTAAAFRAFLEEAGQPETIACRLRDLDVDDHRALETSAAEIKSAIPAESMLLPALEGTHPRRLGLRSSICGQVPSVYPEYADMLVRCGIDSISVNPDAIEQARANVAAAEQHVLLEARRDRTLPRVPDAAQPSATAGASDAIPARRSL